MNFKFSNLLGAPYRGGNILLHGGSQLLTPVGNRVSIVDLQNSETLTLPFENGANVSRIALSPNGVLLLSVDDTGRALLVNVQRRVVLHHFSFKGPVSALKFSPGGRYFAAGVGKLVQVWHTPGIGKSFSPFQLHKTYAACQDTVTCLDWSPDGRWILAGSKDLTVRIFSLQSLKAYKPVTLSGHRDTVVAAFFHGLPYAQPRDESPSYGIYSLARDGALFAWKFVSDQGSGAGLRAEPQEGAAAALKPEPSEEGDHGRGGGEISQTMEAAANGSSEGSVYLRLDEGQWELENKHFFMQSGAKLSAVDYHPKLNLLVAGFSTGIFGLYQLPDFTAIHLLSISRERITTVQFNETGDWLAFGCAKLGQLLVWEWRSETYVLKQQGHYFDVNALAFSPDGNLLATGADDNKLKVWNMSSGFCFVTLTEHTMPITAVHFLPNGGAILSASMDGTVRAWDLLRYRNFRTFTSPTPTQLAALAVHPSGELVCAASMDTFQIFVWSMKTGRMLDILSGHEGPVHALAFSPTQESLASASWDSTVRIWDVYEAKSRTEALQHSHDVLALAYRPDGRQLASATLDGQIYLWDPLEGELQGSIEGRRDVAGGRLGGDRQSAANSSAGKCFHSLCYSADGTLLLAAGSSRYICCYDVAEKVLLRRFEISSNKSLDGVLDKLNSKRMTDAGPLDLLDLADSDAEEEGQVVSNQGMGLPGAVANRGRPVVRAKSIRISPTGRAWAAATTEGVLIYSMDDDLVFDPTDLDVDVTPQAVEAAVDAKRYMRALQLALRLNEPALLRKAVEAVPAGDIGVVVGAVPRSRLAALLAALAHYLDHSPHLEFLLRWCQEVCVIHGKFLQAQGSKQLLPVMRALQKGLTRLHEDLAQSSATNRYLLEYLTSVAVAPAPRTPESEQPQHVKRNRLK